MDGETINFIVVQKQSFRLVEKAFASPFPTRYYSCDSRISFFTEFVETTYFMHASCGLLHIGQHLVNSHSIELELRGYSSSQLFVQRLKVGLSILQDAHV